MTDDELMSVAREVAGRAYCPYSGFRVGAALLSRSGQVHAGCNVENASYGVTICAERGALMSGRAAEGEEFAIARVALCLPGIPREELPAGGWPCGACRQALAEFASDEVMVLSTGEDPGFMVTSTMGELLPMAFRGAVLK
ncbi:MAG: cytidine deaminase [Verrucomicrobiota bacterium JB023]|nr:cytidine deaminase [Verrucomicrobiota bacterium JB023]